MAVASGDLTLRGGATIGSGTRGPGDAGTVQVGAHELTIDGRGGDVNLATAIESQAEVGSTGNAGSVLVDAGRIRLLSGGAISTATAGEGRAGDISVKGGGSLLIAGRDELGSTARISSDTFGSGGAGKVDVRADGELTLRAGGAISSSTFASGAAGDVAVRAPRVTVDGSGTREVASGQPGIVFGLTGIFSQAEPQSTGGGAGNVFVGAGQQLVVTENGKVSSSTFSSGNAGTVTVGGGGVSSGDIRVSSLGEIRSSTFGGGDAGTVIVRGSSILIDGSGDRATAADSARTGINSRTERGSTGDAGRVEVVADGRVMVAGGGISSSSFGVGGGGNVVVTAGDAISVQGPNARVSALSEGAKGAGTITLGAPSVVVRDGGAVTTQSSTSNGGDVTIRARDLVYLSNGRIETTVAGGAGSGGNINIDPNFVVLNDGIIRANAFGGNGGNITIVAGQIIRSPGSVIEASSRLGISGMISIQAPASDVTGSLAELSGNLLEQPTLRREGCSGPARAERQPSSLVALGRGGLPPDGGEQRSAGYFAGQGIRGTAAERPKEHAASTPDRTKGTTLRITC